ncbi:MAG: homoserine kinase [Acidimicrobiales bacterium]
MHARAPASSANLGPGFDALALALRLAVEVEIRPAPRLAIHAEGEGAELAWDASHLAARVATAVAGHDHLEITVRSSIPVGRGLGSSAALAAAAAAAAGSPDPLGVAAAFDGHAENAAASVLGGLVAATLIEGRPVTCRLRLDPTLAFVVVVPDRRLPTERARAVLPASVAFVDAVANLGRLALLVGGLADAAQLVAAAGEDRLHQVARAPLFPEAPELLARLREAGATTACWSGAGTSLLGICTSAGAAARVREAGEAALAALGVAGRAFVLEPDLVGLTVGEA